MSLVVGQLVRPVVGVHRQMALGVVSEIQHLGGHAALLRGEVCPSTGLLLSKRTLIKVSFLTAELKEHSWYLPEHLEIIVE
tara:strand:+ start:215 stop:457 length:243 start_codon:yes stop_codon:yes gene_type:complete